MKIVPFRIPKQIVLPGLTVQVRLVPKSVTDSGEWEYDGEGTAVIRIWKRAPIHRKRYLLIHELQHVMTDYLHMAIQNHPDIICP